MVSKKSTHLVFAGKRKRAVAKAVIGPGSGRITINSVPIENYNNEFYRMRLSEPLYFVEPLKLKSVNIAVNVAGGGVSAQTDACRLAIANALVEYFSDEKLKQSYLNYDRNMLVSDVRRNEPHKPRRSKARARRQKSYR